MSSSTETTKNYRSSLSRPRCISRIYPQQSHGSGGQAAPSTETTGQSQIVNALGAPFVLEGLFGEVDAEAMDIEPNSELAGDAMGMDVEDDMEGAAATADGRMIVDDDGTAAQNSSTLCVFHPT